MTNNVGYQLKYFMESDRAQQEHNVLTRYDDLRPITELVQRDRRTEYKEGAIDSTRHTWCNGTEGLASPTAPPTLYIPSHLSYLLPLITTLGP